MDEREKRLRKAAMLGKIEFCPTFEIDRHEDIARDFLRSILAVNYDATFISDESRLCDFSTCGLPKGIEYDTLEAARAAWEEWVIASIAMRYGVHITTTHILLTELFERIKRQ